MNTIVAASSGPLRRVHQEEALVELLDASAHRLTSDSSTVLMYVRTYKRTLLWGARAGGPGYQLHQLPLPSILIRLDLTDDYEELVKKKVPLLGQRRCRRCTRCPSKWRMGTRSGRRSQGGGGPGTASPCRGLEWRGG